MAAVQTHHEIRDAVTVRVAVNVGIAADLLVAKLAGDMVEAFRSDKRKAIVAAGKAVRIEQVKIDLVSLARVEVGDLVGTG